MRRMVLLLALAGVGSAQTMLEVSGAVAGGATGAAAGKKVSDGITSIFGKVDKQAADAAKPNKPGIAKSGDKSGDKSGAKSADAKQADAKSADVKSAAATPADVKPAAPRPSTPALAQAGPATRRPPDLRPLTPAIQRAVVRHPAQAPDLPPMLVRVVAPPVAPGPAPLLQTLIAVPLPQPPPQAPPQLPAQPPATLDDLKTIVTGTNREDVLKLGAPASRIMMLNDGHLAETFLYTAQDVTLGVVRLSDGVVSTIELR
jgi:hypothetical protein